jgi:hypothetical protein
MKKEYQLTYADGYEMRVEIDHSILTEEKLHELNNFWGGARERLIRDSVLNAVLKMLCSTFMAESVDRMDVEAAFNSGEIEGWPPLDGSWGIKLLDYEPFEFVSDLVDVLED